MSRRRPALFTRRGRARLRHRALALAAAAGGIGWAWHTHPAALTAAAASAAALTLAALALRVGRPHLLGRPTCVYHHWLDDRYIPPMTPPWRRDEYQYIGISNRPDLRREQHAADSWWYPLADPARYEQRWYRNRLTALAVETRLIRRHAPIGNTKHNRRWRRQRAERARLRAVASLHPATPRRAAHAPAPGGRLAAGWVTR